MEKQKTDTPRQGVKGTDVKYAQRHKVSTGMENRTREATMHELLRGKRGGGHTPVAFALPSSPPLLLLLFPLPFLLRVRLFSASWSRRRPWGGIHQFGIFAGKKTAPKVRTNATLRVFSKSVQQPVDKVSLYFSAETRSPEKCAHLAKFDPGELMAGEEGGGENMGRGRLLCVCVCVSLARKEEEAGGIPFPEGRAGGNGYGRERRRRRRTIFWAVGHGIAGPFVSQSAHFQGTSR